MPRLSGRHRWTPTILYVIRKRQEAMEIENGPTHSVRKDVSPTRLSRNVTVLHIPTCLWLLVSFGLLFSGRNLNTPRQCHCVHGGAPAATCHGPGRAACIRCDAGYTLAASTKGGNGDDAPSCLANTCFCIDGTPLTGVGCRKDGLFRCSACKPGFALSNGVMCKPVPAAENETAAVKFDSQPVGNFAGFARNTPFVRSEGGKDNDCINEFDDSFDQASGWVDFQTLCISDAAFAKRAGTCVGKSPRANVLDISFKHFSRIPERKMASCIEQFIRGYGGTQSLKTLESLDTSGNMLWLGDPRLVESIFSRLPRLSKLNVGNNVLGTDTASMILSQLGSLESLDMSSNRLDFWMQGEQVFKHLSRLPRLSQLNLAHNSLTADKVGLFLINLVHLETLDISRNCLNVGGRSLLVQALSRMPRLSKLNVAHNLLDEESVDEVLSPLVSLESLDISNNRFLHGNARLVGNTLSKMPRLSKLNLAQNLLNAESADKFLSPLVSLESLDISDNIFLRENARLVGNTLSKMPRLSKLNLAQNWLDAENADELLSPLVSLESLDISDNLALGGNARLVGNTLSKLPRLSMINLGKTMFNEKAIGDMFCQTCSPLPALSTLLLPDNFIHEIASFGASLVNVIPALKGLNMSSNRITGKSVVEFIGVLPTNSRLHVLDLSENCISPEMVVKIIAAVVKRLPNLRISGLDHQRTSTRFPCQKIR